MKRSYLVCSLALIGFLSIEAQENVKWGEWNQWGSTGKETYRNPVIPADYSDIDCIRVGDDYYAISSTFQFSPGMILLHSKDLVHWTIAGHAVNDVTQISPNFNWDQMNGYGKGVWAGTIRHHKNRFYVFFGTPEEGFFMTSAPSVEGPWEPLCHLWEEKGWDDCSVYWDEEEGPCFVGTHFADGYKTYLFKMSDDGKQIDRSSAILVHSGAGREASKLIKVGDWFYLIYSEHYPSEGRYVMAKRSSRLFGPYDETRQLTYACREAMEPNQGGLVDADGKWYFFTHHGTGNWDGRVASLLPVTWIEGWPVIGTVTPDTIGVMTWEGRIPVLPSVPLEIQRSDSFDEKALSVQWEWNFQPRESKWSLFERAGWLRLKAFLPLKPDDLMRAGNTLTQRCFRSRRNVVEVKMDLSGMSDGQKAGLCHFSKTHSAIGVYRTAGKWQMEYRENGRVTEGPEIRSALLWLRSSWGLDGVSTYLYSVDGINYQELGPPYQLTWGNYRGDRFGIYCFNDRAEKGCVDIDYVEYQMEK